MSMSREKLYEEAWSEPMLKPAARYVVAGEGFQAWGPDLKISWAFRR